MFSRFGIPTAKGLLCLSVLGVVLVLPARAAVTITGVVNKPASQTSTVPEVANADNQTLVPLATFQPILQELLTKQGYSAANNWTLGSLNLTDPTAFNITTYTLGQNPAITPAVIAAGNNGGLPNGTAAGVAFGETMAFALNPDLTGPVGPFANGTVVTEHWLQIFNANTATANGYAGTQLAAPNNQGYWYIDNGFFAGAKVPTASPGFVNTPYYDNNGGLAYNATFLDTPMYFSGVGTYLHFDVVPVWDIYTPGVVGGAAATDTIDIGNFSLAWGFSVVPEPSSMVLACLAAVGLAVASLHRRRRHFKS